MKKVYISIFTLFTVIAASAQSSFKVSLSTKVTAIIQNPAGNFVLTSYISNISASNDVLLYEIDSASGSVIRSKQFLTNSSDIPNSICNTLDGNYLITGNFANSGADIFVAKLDTGFNIIWYRQMGHSYDIASRVEVVDSGLYAVTGSFSNSGYAKPSIVYLNDSGNVVKEFHLTYNGPAHPRNFKAKLLSDGTFGFTGLASDLCIVDTAGNILINDSVKYGAYYPTADIILNSNGEYAVLLSDGYGGSYHIPGVTTSALCVFDHTGTNLLMSSNILNGGISLEPKQILQDRNGNYLIVVDASVWIPGYSNGAIIKLNTAGSIIWSKQFAPMNGFSYIDALMIASDGSYVLAVHEEVLNPGYYIIKMDTSGNVCGAINLPTQLLPIAKGSGDQSTIFIDTISIVSTSIPSDTFGPNSSITLCSGISGIKESPDYFSVLYPNPSNDRLHIETTIANESIVTICSTEGKIISTHRFNQIAEIDIHSLSPGIYILRINDESGNMIAQRKIVKY